MVRGRRTSKIVQVTPAERHELESWERSTTIKLGMYRRSRIILCLTDGASISETARKMGVRRHNVYKWIERFLEAGPCGLESKPRTDRPSKLAKTTAGLQSEFPLQDLETPLAS